MVIMTKMNLNAYDSMTPSFHTWVTPDNKKLYSDIIPYYRFYTFLKRYNNSSKEYDYYIAFSNKEDATRRWYRVYLTKSKSIKLDMTPIWNQSIFRNVNVKQEISVNIDEEYEDGVVYHIDI